MRLPTVTEFAASRLPVTVVCRACGRGQVLAPDVMDAAFGPDFDLIAGRRQVSTRFYCPHCGAGPPDVLIGAEATARRSA